jgi:glutathione peroxidase
MAMVTSGLLISFTMNADHHEETNALSFKMKNIQDQYTDLSQYKGKVVLMVNVASKCGYTPQYDGLQKLYSEYKDKGFTIIGFPCNNFGAQEPGTHAEILSFCKDNYGVTFPMMGKIDVKGESQAPLYKYLTSHPDHGGQIRWNFEKFLIDKKGNVLGHYPSKVTPQDADLKAAISKALQAE